MIRGQLATLVICALLPFVSNGAPDPHTITPSTTAGAAPPKADAALAGTAWQLVEIVSMNGRVDAPDDRSLYTLAFQADGSLSLSADCNRGTGSWTSPSPGQLQFGQIAATQALCPPGSWHDRYMAQVPWVRSYVLKDGHLFLATMAGGASIEFEPMQLPLAATVLGEEVRTSDPGEMQKSEEEARAFKTPPWEHATAGAETRVLPVPSAKSAKPPASETVGPAEAGTASPLAGTRWRLRRFQSMDDATGEIEPEDPSAYTMTLNEDGSVQMRLNCNRAVGTWSVKPASDGKSGTFTFGPLATTRAPCPQPSMDERIVRDAEWIRGYLLRDGQLHLSLMADGGIYSWEPVSEE